VPLSVKDAASLMANSKQVLFCQPVKAAKRFNGVKKAKTE
jgi:hypothetical protein